MLKRERSEIYSSESLPFCISTLRRRAPFGTMTASTSSPNPLKPHGPQLIATPKQARSHRRALSNLQAQIVEAARERVPNVEAPKGLTKTGARSHLKEARRQFASGANRFLNRATRRSLAREVGLA
jgi:hypothetical protein